MLPLFTINQKKENLLYFPQNLFICAIPEHNILMEPLILPEPCISETQHKRKKMLLPEFYLETLTWEEQFGRKLAKFQELTLMFLLEGTFGRIKKTMDTGQDTELDTS